MRQGSSVRSTRSRPIRGLLTLAGLLHALLLSCAAGAASQDAGNGIQLELSPRVCTLASNDKQCDTLVHASWRSSHDESLCLVIVDRPEVKRCWEKYAEGTYSLELVFTEDLIFQLKDLGLEHVLASDVLRVIREAIRYRHKRRQPWNIFD